MIRYVKTVNKTVNYINNTICSNIWCARNEICSILNHDKIYQNLLYSLHDKISQNWGTTSSIIHAQAISSCTCCLKCQIFNWCNILYRYESIGTEISTIFILWFFWKKTTAIFMIEETSLRNLLKLFTFCLFVQCVYLIVEIMFGIKGYTIRINNAKY